TVGAASVTSWTVPGPLRRPSAYAAGPMRPLPDDLEQGTIVVLPSATLPSSELRKIVGIQYYEERLLCTALLLRHPDLRIVYLTSLPVDEAVVDYYLRFVPDPADARGRLHLVAVGNPEPRALTEKVLEA